MSFELDRLLFFILFILFIAITQLLTVELKTRFLKLAYV